MFLVKSVLNLQKETTTVAPSLGLPISIKPNYAVKPVIPNTPKYADKRAIMRG